MCATEPSPEAKQAGQPLPRRLITRSRALGRRPRALRSTGRVHRLPSISYRPRPAAKSQAQRRRHGGGVAAGAARPPQTVAGLEAAHHLQRRRRSPDIGFDERLEPPRAWIDYPNAGTACSTTVFSNRALAAVPSFPHERHLCRQRVGGLSRGQPGSPDAAGELVSPDVPVWVPTTTWRGAATPCGERAAIVFAGAVSHIPSPPPTCSACCPGPGTSGRDAQLRPAGVPDPERRQ